MLTERNQYMSGSSCLPFQSWEVSKYFYPHSHVTARETVLETKWLALDGYTVKK